MIALWILIGLTPGLIVGGLVVFRLTPRIVAALEGPELSDFAAKVSKHRRKKT